LEPEIQADNIYKCVFCSTGKTVLPLQIRTCWVCIWTLSIFTSIFWLMRNTQIIYMNKILWF